VLPETDLTNNMSESVFSGFPARAEVTPIPNLFFTEVVPQVDSINELKVVLHIFWLLSRRRGYPQLVTGSELSANTTLMRGMEPVGAVGEEVLHQALEAAEKHGIILHVRVDRAGQVEDAYLINNDAGRDAIIKIKQGDLPELPPAPVRSDMQAAVPNNIYSLYESNIGMITQLISEQLKEAEKLYPPEWIESAFKEAVALNKRNWRYILRILERWDTEGKDDGKFGRDFKKETDPDKYIKGKYGHVVRR
jgi:DNA replication protein